jgi:glutathione peroxidase-family protein
MSSKLSTLFNTAMRTIGGAPFKIADVAGDVLLVTNVASY